MKIIFEPWREEVICDNHGCPCRTDYLTTFKVGGVQFVAQCTNHLCDVDIYHEYHHVTNISGNKNLTYVGVEKLIEAEFVKESPLKDYWREVQKEYLKQVGEKLLHEGLNND